MPIQSPSLYPPGTMSSASDILFSSRAFHPLLSVQQFSRPNSVRKAPKSLKIYSNTRVPRIFAASQKSASENVSQSDSNSKSTGDDFISRVLRDNPSQVEPRYLVGDRLYTLSEKEKLSKVPDIRIFQLAKKLLEKSGMRKEDEIEGQKGESSGPVYLKDILKEFKGQLYAPEQVFKVDLSEEKEFNRNLGELPKMSFEDFQKALKSDKVKLLTSKSDPGTYSGYRDFIVDLKQIPGDKRLQRTKWYTFFNPLFLPFFF